MLDVNVRQQDYYESRHEAKQAGLGASERAANEATRAWTWLRRRIMGLRSAAGVDDYLLDLHRRWLGDLRGKRVLDLGCFDGNALSLWLAEQAAEYVGIDLSEHAVAELNRKLEERGLTTARAEAIDLLANSWPDASFDVVYAYSVLHHFADLDVVLAELRRILRPDGLVVTMDPLKTEPVNRLVRALYRPFQTDRDWEFPFDRAALRAFERDFRIEERRGLLGAVKLAFPFLVVPALARFGKRLAARLLAFDDRRSRTESLAFYTAWLVALKLRAVTVARDAAPTFTAAAARVRKHVSAPPGVNVWMSGVLSTVQCILA
jgi:2-polyprenyl-3-methyl-5-hydroxy-6-metoxy-1,4-benzoquinol methylase